MLMLLYMPSQILHTLFGEDVIIKIHGKIAGRFGIIADKALEKIQSAYKTAFTLGCQGPDIFYHSRNRRPVGLEYGTLLHRRGAGIFTSGLLKMGLPNPPPDEEDIRAGRREKGINPPGAYALGFMTHAILDRAAHPYIVYKTAFIPPEVPDSHFYSLFHLYFERILDTLMWRRLRGKEISAWDQEKMLAEICGNPPLGLMELLSRSLVLAFPERAGRDEKLSLRIENTFADCKRFYAMTAPRLSGLNSKNENDFTISHETLAYIYPLDLSDTCCGMDFLNLEKQPWHYPVSGSKEDCRSFPEIYADAVEAAVASISPVIEAYLETGIFPIAEAGRAIGNSGLSITDENGKPRAPDFSNPLPLEKVIMEQAEMRGVRTQKP